jgi:hypothetical protein
MSQQAEMLPHYAEISFSARRPLEDPRDWHHDPGRPPARRSSHERVETLVGCQNHADTSRVDLCIETSLQQLSKSGQSGPATLIGTRDPYHHFWLKKQARRSARGSGSLLSEQICHDVIQRAPIGRIGAEHQALQAETKHAQHRARAHRRCACEEPSVLVARSVAHTIRQYAWLGNGSRCGLGIASAAAPRFANG